MFEYKTIIKMSSSDSMISDEILTFNGHHVNNANTLTI